MTVATDLQRQNCPRSMLFAQIEGLEPILCERVDSPPAAAWTTRSMLACLRPPDEEWSQGLDLGEMTVKPSAQTFTLDDIPDPTDSTRSYFGRLFAPGRWSQSGVARSLLADVEAGPAQYVGANATAIEVKNAADFPASGTAYIGQETFSYFSITGNTFNVDTRGLYPPVGTELGGTYRIPVAGAEDYWTEVTEVPYSWLGRLIALYIVTYDELAGAWHAYDDKELLWVGRISDRVRFDSDTIGWQLVAEHVLKDLDRQIATDLPRVMLESINLSGPLGRTFTAQLHWAEAALQQAFAWATAYITIAAGFYKSADDVMSAIVTQLNLSTNWQPDWSVNYYMKFAYCPAIGGDAAYLMVRNFYATVLVHLAITPYDTRPGAGTLCQALHACGFDIGKKIEMDVPPGGSPTKIQTDATPFAAYHPLSQAVNGSKLAIYYAPASDLWTNQGDFGATLAYLAIRKASLIDMETGTYLAAYNGFFVGGTAPGFGYIAADKVSGVELSKDPRETATGAWAGQRFGEEPCWIDQIYKPVQVPNTGPVRGPFQMLLYPLLSSGTPGTNHGLYDALVPTLSLGIPSAIVDTASFLEADSTIVGGALANRHLYVIAEPTTIGEMLKRECKLFGFFLAWDRGKLRLRSLRRNNYDTWTETLSDAAKTEQGEWPSPEWSHETVINQWKCKVNYNLDTGKYGPEITIRNARSRQALRVTKSVTIEHPGVCINSQSENVIELLNSELLAGAEYLGLPVAVVNVSLAHTRMLRLAIGDVVLFTSSLQYDPFGSGLLSTSCHALVVDLAWKFASRKGRASLLQLSRYAESEKPPWGACALVDITATNGGWNATTKQLTLVPFYVGDADCDAKDGSAFKSGYTISIFESTAANGWVGIYVPLMFGTVTVAKDFEADGPNLLTVEEDLGASWDPDKEYVVIPGAYETCTTAQQFDGLYPADPSTLLIESTWAAKLWGG